MSDPSWRGPFDGLGGNGQQSQWSRLQEELASKVIGQIASATGLFNLAELDWDEEAMAVACVRREQLSTLVPTTHHVHGLPSPIALELGLDADTPFVVGANDGVLSNLGVNAIGPGEVAVTIGTSGAMRAVVDRPMTDPSGRTFCYALTEHHWVVGGPVNNGGIIFRWKDQLDLNWKYKSVGLDLINNYQSGYYDNTRADSSTVVPVHVGGFSTWDSQLSYSGVKNLMVRVGLKNMFNRLPPEAITLGSYFQQGYDPTYYDAHGQTAYVNATYKF